MRTAHTQVNGIYQTGSALFASVSALVLMACLLLLSLLPIFSWADEPLPATSEEVTTVLSPDSAPPPPVTLPIPRGKGINPDFVQAVFTEICRLGIREPQIVMRQAMLETGWLRSPFLMKRNNLFGFRHKTYLSFPSWQDSVKYYYDWQNRRLKESDKNYYTFLMRIRYGVPSYVNHVKKMKWDADCSLVINTSQNPANNTEEEVIHTEAEAP